MGHFNELSMTPDIRPFADEGWSANERKGAALPEGCRIAHYSEPGWSYRTPTHRLWITDAPPCERCGGNHPIAACQQPAPQPLPYTKRVGDYDPATRQYPAYVSIDGADEQLVGHAWSVGAADRLADDYLFHHFSDSHTPEKAARITAAAPHCNPQNDVCWSCGDQLTTPTPDPALCPACQEADAQWPEIKPVLESSLIVSTPIEPPPCEGNDELVAVLRETLAIAIFPSLRLKARLRALLERLETGAARVNWSERPAARLIPCEGLRRLYRDDLPSYRAQLAALDEESLARQAAASAAYDSLITGKQVTAEEMLVRFRRAIVVHEAEHGVELAVTMFATLESDPPSAGRALQRQLGRDYTGTLRRLFRLDARDQRLLAGAYIAYDSGGGWTVEELLGEWRTSLARSEADSTADWAPPCADTARTSGLDHSPSTTA